MALFFLTQTDKNQEFLPMWLSELTVYDINGNERTIDAISAKNNLSLSYKNNTLKFNLASLSYQKSNKNKYAYRIPEINDFWINLDKNRELTLTNLKPGNYSFIYKGSNGDGFGVNRGNSRSGSPLLLGNLVGAFVVWPLFRRDALHLLSLPTGSETGKSRSHAPSGA